MRCELHWNHFLSRDWGSSAATFRLNWCQFCGSNNNNQREREREISNAFSPAATFDWICNVFRSILLCCSCCCLVLHDQSEFASFSWSLRLQCLSKFDCQLIVYSSFLIFTLRFSFSSFSPLFPTVSMSLFLSVAWAVNILIKMSRAMRRSLSLFLSLPLPLPPPSRPCISRLSYQLCALSLISSLPDKAKRSGPIVCQQRRHFVFVLLSFLCFFVFFGCGFVALYRVCAPSCSSCLVR